MSSPLPNLIIAGVGKAGTTSLFHHLGSHPEVCAASVKETGYFSPLRFGGGNLAPLEDYQRFFTRCQSSRWIMEATPDYWYGGRRVIDAIRNVLGRPRIIISLRDPVDRLWSNFRYLKSRTLIPQEMIFEQFLARCFELRSTGDDRTEQNRFYRALSLGFYVEHLTEWIDGFGEDLKLVFFEDLVENPPSVLVDICGWLGVDGYFFTDRELPPQNAAVSHKALWLQRLAYSLAGRSRGIRRSYPRLHRWTRAAYLALNGRGEVQMSVESMNPDVRYEIEGLYRPANEQLELVLRRRGFTEFPEWIRSSTRFGSSC